MGCSPSARVRGDIQNSMGNATAAVIGFATLLVAHHLSVGGDTLEMLRLADNNLASHSRDHNHSRLSATFWPER